MPLRFGVRHCFNGIQHKVPLQRRKCPRRSNSQRFRGESIAFFKEPKGVRLSKAIFNKKLIEATADRIHLIQRAIRSMILRGAGSFCSDHFAGLAIKRMPFGVGDVGLAGIERVRVTDEPAAGHRTHPVIWRVSTEVQIVLGILALELVQWFTLDQQRPQQSQKIGYFGSR